jgi:hypothetical protein
MYSMMQNHFCAAKVLSFFELCKNCDLKVSDYCFFLKERQVFTSKRFPPNVAFLRHERLVELNDVVYHSILFVFVGNILSHRLDQQ